MGRFVSVDPARSNANWYSYCRNNPLLFFDPLGLSEVKDEELSEEAGLYITYYGEKWQEAKRSYDNATTDEARKLAQAEMDRLHYLADDIREKSLNGNVYGVYYNVPVFAQGASNLCWAYSQTMIENYKNGLNMSQSDADVRAVQIARSVYGDGIDKNGKTVWNRASFPTNSPNIVNGVDYQINIYNFSDLSNVLDNGPAYGYYNNLPQFTESDEKAHLVVITGAVYAEGHVPLVTTNNPWGIANIQTYGDFMNGIPNDSNGMHFVGALKAN